LNCKDSNGNYRGLIEICKDLKLIDENSEKNELFLLKLREKLSGHTAFEDESNIQLINLANKFGIKISWNPKYHCELNPIEGLWCHSKHYVRKNNDQDYSKLNNLICESFENFKIKNVNIQLWNRFWRAIEMYDNNASYEDVLTSLFGAKQSATIVSHKKNINFNKNLNNY